MHHKLIQQAKREIELADHLIYVTYPLIKEAKFLLSISEHVTRAAELALLALLTYEREYKRIDPFAKNFAVMIDVFHPEIERRYGFGSEHLHLLRKLAEFKQYNRESVMKFTRKDKYILTTQEYNMQVLDLSKVKRMCEATKKFIKKAETAVGSAEQGVWSKGFGAGNKGLIDEAPDC